MYSEFLLKVEYITLFSTFKLRRYKLSLWQCLNTQNALTNTTMTKTLT